MFYYTPGEIETILLPLDCNKEKNQDKSNKDQEKSTDSKSLPNNKRKSAGKPSLVSKFPDLVDIVANFMKQNGFSTQFRRRTETGNSCGATIKRIQDYVFENVKGLKEYGISDTTIRRLFEAPHKTRNNTIRYKAYVNVRVGVKSNQFREYHPDTHHLFARNKQIRELAELFSEITNLFSIDDMAKVKVAAPAVSSYHQFRRLCAANDMPNFSDHDFSIPGYFINVVI